MTVRERLLKKRPRFIEVDGDKIPVRSLTIAEGDKVEALQTAGDNDALANFILSRVMIEDDGSQMFSDENDPAIQDVPVELVVPILDKVRSFSKPKSIDAIEKNSEATPKPSS